MRVPAVDLPSLTGPQGFHGLAETIAAPLTASVLTFFKGGRLSNEPKNVCKVRLAFPSREFVRELDRQIEKDQGGNIMDNYELNAQVVLFFAILGGGFFAYMVFDTVRSLIQCLRTRKRP